MNRIKNSDKIIGFCFANSFEFGMLVNVVLIYCGVAFWAEEARHYIFIALSCAFFAFMFWVFVKDMASIKLSKKGTLILFIFIGFYLLGLIISLFKFGLSPALKEYLPKLLIISGACFMSGFIGAKRELGSAFIEYLEKGSIVVIPLASYYSFVHFFNCANYEWNYGADIGVLNYMDLAYLFMPYMLAHILAFVFESDRRIVVFKKEIIHTQLVRAIVVFIYWIAILSSGTRGAYVSIICFIIAVFVAKVKEKYNRIVLILPLSIIAVMLFLGLIWRPEGMNRMTRWDSVINGVKEGEFKTDDIEVFENEEQLEKFAETHNDNNDDLGDRIEENTENTINLNREELFKLAIYEFKLNPIIGMGPVGYSVKYGAYPHNIVLELLAETGVVGTIIYLGLILYILFAWVFIKKKEKHEIEMLCFLVAYMAEVNISGSLWNSVYAVFFAVAYGTVMIETGEQE